MSEQLKHKMQQWEAAPPPGCWDAIAFRLGDTTAYAAARLYHKEIPPPVAAWPAIASGLQQEAARPQAPVRPLHKRALVRTAVAAALLVIAGGLWYRQHRRNDAEAALSTASAADHQPPRAAAKTIVQADEEDNTSDDNHTGYSKPAPNPAYAHTLKYAAVSAQPAFRPYPITVQHASLPASGEATLAHNMNALLTGNYLIITGPNGETTRASLKIAEALRYLYGDNDADDNSDKNNNENSHWRSRLQEWRNKIISSRFVPASTNFLDISDLKDLIDEKP